MRLSGSRLERVFNIIHEQTRKPAPNPVTRVLSEGMVVGLANHTVLIARDGRETAIDDSAAPIRDENGEISGVVMVFHDVTEQRRTGLRAAGIKSIAESKPGRILKDEFRSGRQNSPRLTRICAIFPLAF